MRPRVYIDTSVIGGCFDEEFAEWSKRLFDEFRQGVKIAVVSDVTRGELAGAPEAVQRILADLPEGVTQEALLTDEAELLAERYVGEGVIHSSNVADAQHIAIATVERADVLVSWNFKHIVNVGRIRSFNGVNLRLGYPILDIRTPREALDEEDL